MSDTAGKSGDQKRECAAVHIREVREESLDAVMMIMNDAFSPEYGEAWTKEQVQSTLCLPYVQLYVAEQDNIPAGFCLTRSVAGESEILLIAVARLMRRNGLASIMVQNLISRSKKSGVEKIFLEMRKNNDALFFYQKMGFQPIGERPDYYRRADGQRLNAITMAMIL